MATATMKKYFPITPSDDGMKAYIPANERIDKEVKKWDFETFKKYIKDMGYVVEPKIEIFDTVIEKVSTSKNYWDKDFLLLRGIAPKASELGRIEWLNKEPIPQDHAVANIPFLKIVAPKPAEPGQTVLGQPVGINEEYDELSMLPIELELADEMVKNEDDTIQSSVSGKVFLNGKMLELNPIYEIEVSRLSDYQKAEFFCNIKVKGDLEGTINWKINGNLHVEGHLSVATIEVYGDLQADSGIQTNMNGVLKVYGNLTATYIQLSKVGVLKDANIDTGIVLSELRVGGNLKVRGSPGAIVGSKVDCYGAITANRAGSDKGRNTQVRVYARETEGRMPVTRINLVCAGTFMQIYDNVWTVKSDGFYESSADNPSK